MRLSFMLGNGKKLIILSEVVERLFAFRQTKKHQREAGGLLIGRHILETEHLVVDRITEPSWRDWRLASLFHRSNHHNRMLHRSWIDSEKTLTLLGLWHTHPQSIPHPSDIDWEDWRKTLFHGDYVGDSLVFLIVGRRRLRVWQGDRAVKFVELEPFENGHEDL